MLPTLTVHRGFVAEFAAAAAPCFAMGVAEEAGRPCGFLALRPEDVIPPTVTDRGFRFGHSLLGTAEFEVVHFAFEFYGFGTYNVLVNPASPLVRAVLSLMVGSGDYLFFALGGNGRATAFRSGIGPADVAGLAANLPRILGSATTDAQYERALASFARNPYPAGTLLSWVCRDGSGYLNPAQDPLALTPS